MEEKEIIKQCINGNREAQKALYNLYGKYLLGIAYRYCELREDAEEVFHDTMMKIYNNISNFGYQSSFKTWITKICINISIDYIRKNKKKLMIEYISENTYEKADSNEMYENEFRIEGRMALDLLNKLPDNQKLIINLFLIDEFSHKEIAEKLGISEGASRVQYNRAKKNLMEKVKFKISQNESQQR